MGPRLTGSSPSDDELARRWAAAHPGMSASAPLVRGWLRLMWRLAAPLAARGASPSAITAAGGGLGVLALAAAWPGGRWPALAALALVLASALADGLDGAVAIRAGRVSLRGTRLDRAADRVVDACWALILWRLGAPWWAAAMLIAATLAQESARRRLDVAGLITVCERPSRLICTALAALSAVIAPAAAWPASVCAGVWGGLAAVALIQLARRAGRPAAR